MTEHQGPSYDHGHVYILLQIRLLLKQSSWLNLHPGYFLTWENPWMPHLASTSGIHLSLAFSWSISLIAGTTQYEQLCFLLPGPQPVVRNLPVALVAPWYLSNIGRVSCHLHNPLRTLLSHQSKGLGWSGEVQKWHHFSSGPNQRVHSGRQSIWPFHNVGKPLSSQGLYNGGSSQTTNPTDLYWAWLALWLSAA